MSQMYENAYFLPHIKTGLYKSMLQLSAIRK